MSNYTTQLGYIIDSGFDIGLQDYPIFDEAHRTILNNKIIEHFRFREIGLETPALFKVFLNRKMNEIMPLYNQRYKSETVEFNPLNNVLMDETYTHTTTDTGKNTTTETSNNDTLNVNQDTPQSGLTEEQIKGFEYASSTEHSTDSGGGNSETNTNNTRTETFTHHNEGSSAMFTFSQDIDQWRKVMLNIDMEIIQELEVLFIQLW